MEGLIFGILRYISLATSVKVARYSFSGSIPPKFKQKPHHHKQRFGIITHNRHHSCIRWRWKFVMIRVGMTSELSLQRNDAINHKNFIPKYLDNALTRWLLEEKAPRNDFGRTVPSAEKYCAASKIGNGVNKFSSLSNTTVVAIIPNLCLWRRSLCSNLGGIDPL